MSKFTPELLIEAPRRSSGVPNDAGSHVLFTTSTYSIEARNDIKEVKVLNIETGETSLFSDNDKVQDVQWVTGVEVLWLQSSEGKSEIWVGNAVGSKRAYPVGTVPASISHVQTKLLPNGTVALVFSAPTNAEGEIMKPEDKPASSGREYESAFVRFWDTYFTTERSSLWYTTLTKTDGRYKMGKQVNALKGTGLEFPVLPSNPMGDSGGYEVSESGILLTTMAPDLNPADHFTSTLYYIPLRTFTEEPTPRVQRISVPGFTGSASSPAFSSDGKSAAFAIDKDWEFGDHTSVFLIEDLETPEKFIEVEILNDKGEYWDRQPGSLLWSSDNSKLYLVADDHARAKLYKVPIVRTGLSIRALATAITETGAIGGVYRLGAGTELFYNKTSMVENSLYGIIDPATGDDKPLSSNSDFGQVFGIKQSQVSEFYFDSAGGRRIQSWMVKPSFFDENKTYPIALIVHGGPKSSWADSWTTRWNSALFAEQGYIVIAPNVSGSTGWGAELCEAVRGSWGGNPYDDLVHGWDYVKENFKFADTSRAIALGASYGGYMMYWLAGQPLAKEFKAIVCHDGIWSNVGMLGCDVPFSLKQDMGGELWKKQDIWDKYDPARYTDNWSTPMLIIHSDLDYRCPIVDGLAAYSVCLQKGIPTRFLNFPDENHWVLKKANSLHWYRTVLGWSNKYAGVTDGISLKPPVTEPQGKWKGGK